jgi:hypothetical protein
VSLVPRPVVRASMNCVAKNSSFDEWEGLRIARKAGNQLIFLPFFPSPFPILAKKGLFFIMCDLNDNAILFRVCSSRFELLIGLSAQLVTAPQPLQKESYSCVHFILPITTSLSYKSFLLTAPTSSHAQSDTLCYLHYTNRILPEKKFFLIAQITLQYSLLYGKSQKGQRFYAGEVIGDAN